LYTATDITFFGCVLTNNLLVKKTFDLKRFGNRGQGGCWLVALADCRSRFTAWFSACAGIALAVDQFLIEDLIAEIDALIADVDARTGDQLAHLILRFTAEGAL
jgi:hypothetical protein